MAQYNSKSTPADTAALFAMVFLFLTILVLAGIYFLRQNVFTAPDAGTAENTLPHVIGTEASAQTVSESVTVHTQETTLTTTVSETTATETTSVTESAAEEIPGTQVSASSEYDKAFYDKVLMVGDSLSVGLVNYGYLKPENVFAQVGLTPASVMTTDINEENVYTKASGLAPEYICIMLGTNGLSYLTEDYMAEKMGEFIDALRQTCPEAEIVLISIPPVTAAHEQEKPEKISNITAYNRHIQDLAEEKSVKFVDTFTLLQDTEGYLAADYAENDGLHFKAKAYPVILSAVQSAVGGEAPGATQESPPETVTGVSAGTTVPQSVQNETTTDIVSISG